jgi:hypothetical protein
MWRKQIYLGVCGLIALLMLTSSAAAGKMTFELMVSDVRSGYSWIAAEGEIVAASAADFETYLNKNLQFETDKSRYEILLNSPGGDLIGGIALGEFFRKHKFITHVVNGTCASACAIAFIGGVERDATNGKLGVHQFYNELSLKKPAEKIFNALDMSTQQLMGAILIDYTFRMGVDPRFVAIAAATPPNQIKILNVEELNSLNVNWRPRDFDPWIIEPSGHGIIAVTHSKDKTRTAVLFCRDDKVPRLFLRPDWNNFDWYKDAMESVEGMNALGVTIPRSGVTLKKEHGDPVLELALPRFNPLGVSSANVGVGADGPRYLWSEFSFELPIQNATQTMALALKNCI